MTTSIPIPSTYSETPARPSIDWSAIWGGVFIFAAIWTVFETLALAIFGGASSLANPLSGMGAGIAIWTIVLTIIAMYIAGRETGRRAAIVTRHGGLMHGMMMFGLSVVSAIVLGVLAGGAFATSSATTVGAHSTYVISVGMEWTAFLTLLLGWLAAMGGASTGGKARSRAHQAAGPNASRGLTTTAVSADRPILVQVG